MVSAVLVVASAAAASDTWHEPGTPQGGAVYSLEYGADGTLYAGTQAGIFTSRDGVSWRRGGLFPGRKEDIGVDNISAPAGTVAYAAVDDVLFKSADAGRSWRRIGAEIGDGRQAGLTTVAAPRGRADVVFAGSFNGTLFRSDDGGETWSRTSFGVAVGSRVTVVVVDGRSPNTVYVGTEYEDWRPSGGVYKSTDGGTSWARLNLGLPGSTRIISLALDPRMPETIYAGTVRSGVFKSTDGGRTWKAAVEGLPRLAAGYAAVTDLALDPVAPEIVHAGTSFGIVTSRDGGASWHVGRGDVSEIAALLTDPRVPGSVLAGSLGHGMLRSTDRGEHWRPANAGLTAVLAMAIAVDPARATSVYMGTRESGLLKTSNGGRTWSTVRGVAAETVRAIAVDPSEPRTLYAGTFGDGVLRSSNAGTTWAAANSGLESEFIDALVIDPRRTATVYAAANSEVYRTRNGGRSWRRVLTTSDVDFFHVLAIDPTRPANVYAGADSEADVAVSRNAGKTWKVVNSGLPADDGEIRALVVVPRTGEVFAAVNGLDGPAADSGIGVYRLNRGGTRWAPVRLGLPRLPDGNFVQLRSLAVHPRTGTVYVGSNLGLYELVRDSQGERWRLVDATFAGRTVRRIAFAPDGSRLYAAVPGTFLVSK